MIIMAQRFPKEFWEFCHGNAPVIATGPRFRSVAKDDLGMRPFWRMLAPFCSEVHGMSLGLSSLPRRQAEEVLARFLLEGEYVQALWLNGSMLSEIERVVLSTAALADRIPTAYHPQGLGYDALELLDGMSSPEHYASMVSQHDEGSLFTQRLFQ